ncbi:MAG: sigma 54-interacting transcriptional regulator [Bradymonadaceae bacterium]
MDQHLRDVLQHLVENDSTPILITGSDTRRRTDWARAILEERSGLDGVVILESDRDWERAEEADVDAVVVPSLAAVDDERQNTLLTWVTEGTRVVAAGAANPDKAVTEQEIRVDLYYRLNLAPLPLDEFEATRQRPPDEVLSDALANRAGAEGGVNAPIFGRSAPGATPIWWMASYGR